MHFGVHFMLIIYRSNYRLMCIFNVIHCPLSESQIDKAVRLYESGLLCARVGKIAGVGAETIHRRLQKRGVVLRGPHELRG